MDVYIRKRKFSPRVLSKLRRIKHYMSEESERGGELGYKARY